MSALGVLGLVALLASALVADARIMGEESVQEKMRKDADLSEVSPGHCRYRCVGVGLCDQCCGPRALALPHHQAVGFF